MAKLTFKRGKAYADMLRAYRILIDGEKRGAIRQNETVSLDVAEGTHDVQLKVDWCGSPTIAVTVGPAGATVVCRPSKKLPWLALIYLFLPGRWIDLQVVGGPGPEQAAA